MKPSCMGIEYLQPIFTDAIGKDDAEHMRRTLFATGNLAQLSNHPDVQSRIRCTEMEAA